MKYLLLIACAIFTFSPFSYSVDYSARLDPVIREEMHEWKLGGIAIALVDDQQVIYSAGFGEAKNDSVFRVGSISKLFNAVAVMQQVEAGKLNLDAPLPVDVRPINPFTNAQPMTLRQILCHRSGLQREPSVGGYMDDSEPGLAATVASVTGGVLVTRPEEKTRYSNFGPSIAGHLVERASGQSFEEYQREHILSPLGMTSSHWKLNSAVRKQLVVSHIRVADGRGGWKRQETPVFDLGTIPAGNLFSTAGDLARFASALIAQGKGILKPQTLAEMWQPQLTTEKTGFGLGFMVGNFRGHGTISHSGAVYGHSTSLVILPSEKLAVIVLANDDIVGGRVRRISNTALSLLLEAKLGKSAPSPAPPFTPQKLSDFTGDFESQSYWARLELKDEQLIGEISGQKTKFTPTADLKFVADSLLENETPVAFARNDAGVITGFTMGSQRYERAPKNPAPLPKHWRAFLGSYGLKFIPVIITERHGHLYAMTENMVDYRLTPVNRNVCALPPGMYVDEEVVFLTDKKNRVHSINFANMLFPRRN